jgi:hypothetical protein
LDRRVMLPNGLRAAPDIRRANPPEIEYLYTAQQ